ncbi:M23 family metallopeptidase [Thiovibrio sp. JS02]
MAKLSEILSKKIEISTIVRFCKEYVFPFLKGLCIFCGDSRKQLVTFLNTSHFLTLGVSIALVVAFFLYSVDGKMTLGRSLAVASLAPAQGKQTDGAGPAGKEDSETSFTEIVGEIRPGDSLSSSFRYYGVDEEVRLTVINAFGGLINFRELRPRDKYVVTLDPEGKLIKCLYESGPLDVHEVERKSDGSFRAQKVEIPLTCRTVKVRGTIESSLFAAFASSGEDAKLIYNFADIFASRIDFNTETRVGDSFELVFEKYFKNNAFVGYGNILLARYDSTENGLMEGYYFDTGDQYSASYFDREGNELGASFIRSPVPMGRVTSRFSYNRMHPVLNILRPHLGVDLAAPVGTPIMAAADGRVHFAGWKGGFGKQLIIDHGGGFRTYYGHLSRFDKSIKVGARVRQKQIVGYVGSTGMSTGPHLDYRLAQNGKYMNPFSMKFKPRSVLSGSQLVMFRQEVQSMGQLAERLDDPKLVLVKSVVVTPETRLTLL